MRNGWRGAHIGWLALWSGTCSGVAFNLAQPNPEQIALRDQHRVPFFASRLQRAKALCRLRVSLNDPGAMQENGEVTPAGQSPRIEGTATFEVAGRRDVGAHYHVANEYLRTAPTKNDHRVGFEASRLRRAVRLVELPKYRSPFCGRAPWRPDSQTEQATKSMSSFLLGEPTCRSFVLATSQLSTASRVIAEMAGRSRFTVTAGGN